MTSTVPVEGCADLSVVIATWNAYGELIDSLGSLTEHPPACCHEVIVVDNASSDGSREMIVKRFPRVHLIVLPANRGFGEANNAALSGARGRWVLFLNPDTVVLPGALDALVAYGDAHPEVGVLGPKLLNADGSLQYSCRRFPNLGTGFFRNTPLGRLFPRNRHTQDYLLLDWDHATPRDVDWVSGAALMIRRALLDQTGGFDTTFFMYCEDVDLCKRVGDLGSLVRYLPESVIYHIIGRSTDKVPIRMTYHFHRSMHIFYRKHYAATTSILVRPLIVPGLALRASGQLIRLAVRRWVRQLRRGAK